MLKATINDRSVVIALLCRAFDSNPSVNYIIPQDTRRKERIAQLMAYSFDLCLRFGEVYLTADKGACALVLFPDQKKTSLRTIWLDLKFVLKGISIWRVGKVLKREAAIAACYPATPIYYLWFIGVEPQQQHVGTGGQLLRKLMAAANGMKRPIYLETSVPGNVSWYERNGFEVYQELSFSQQLYMMRKVV
ncbi:GNAT family N-acetyltransferase [Chitinophaga nivalis]|uniref:GNAT family N-acetyltransferase n=1 Tax=Chitinophaga nivalis TaxID=2991709 RepID=A0ABT3IJG6_9BACT|nr:GNAT family N-acetyltransferase [Chitinophaga nivalis]MCW3466203.1 GNAT family N-acetyltransferase [Chitinophaga nivalis]MCW3484106.1 GNAT family N-acetyltransferase [Chitinophaga nivalis]